jgi:hypothetical protein
MNTLHSIHTLHVNKQKNPIFYIFIVINQYFQLQDIIFHSIIVGHFFLEGIRQGDCTWLLLFYVSTKTRGINSA